MATELHTVYLVTPVYIDVAPPNWPDFVREFWRLGGLEQNVGTRVGIEESFLHKLQSGADLSTRFSTVLVFLFTLVLCRCLVPPFTSFLFPKRGWCDLASSLMSS